MDNLMKGRGFSNDTLVNGMLAGAGSWLVIVSTFIYFGIQMKRIPDCVGKNFAASKTCRYFCSRSTHQAARILCDRLRCDVA